MDLKSVDSDLADARTTAHVNRVKIQQSREVIKRANATLEKINGQRDVASFIELQKTDNLGSGSGNLGVTGCRV